MVPPFAVCPLEPSVPMPVIKKELPSGSKSLFITGILMVVFTAVAAKSFTATNWLITVMVTVAKSHKILAGTQEKLLTTTSQIWYSNWSVPLKPGLGIYSIWLLGSKLIAPFAGISRVPPIVTTNSFPSGSKSFSRIFT